MMLRLIQGVLLLGLTVAIHAAVLGAMLHGFQKNLEKAMPMGFIRISWLLTRIAAVTVLAHLLEIAVWAGYYRLSGALPSFETSFYFSSVTYATIGYGDIVLPAPWRLHAAMEGLTGILMCGWSGAFFFAAVNRLYLARIASTVRE
ncbi:MAG TPA: ion channel [Steroidobacteraceae bacterium]|nr:ion channel [Steroidobacteraceae bacterium]